jgi:outer membrane lipoprotein LolB
MSRRIVALLAAASLVSACAHLPLGSDGLSFDQRRTELEAVRSWDMRGRIAVDTGSRGAQGSFRWHQAADRLDLTVRGPFGGGILEVTGTSHALTLTARGESRVLDDPEAQLSALLGWWLPVESLPNWLLGLPDRQFRAATRPGADGTLAAIDQRLWSVDYASYQLAPSSSGKAPGVLIPRRIDLTYGALRLRVTIDDWRPITAAAAP